MAILIVDDEEGTREALRLALTQLGQKTILEAKNGEEGLKVVENEKSRINLIIADWEMPYMKGTEFADKVGQKKEFDQIPFLLITSDLPPGREKEIRNQHRRVDHFLIKPFRSKILEEAIIEAHRHSLLKRDSILWLGSQVIPQAYTTALGQAKSKGFAFAKTAGAVDWPTIAGVVIDSENPNMDMGQANGLKKSPTGAPVPWVCLGRNASSIHPFRSLCHVFVNKESLPTATEWLDLFDKMHRKLINGWQIDTLSQEIKPLIQQKKFEAAKKLVQKLLEVDPFSTDGHLWLAEILFEKRDSAGGVAELRTAIEINPLLPRAYLKMFDLVKGTDLINVALDAEKYCANSSDVMMAAAKALDSDSHPEHARRLSEKAQKKNPKNDSSEVPLAKAAGQKR